MTREKVKNNLVVLIESLIEDAKETKRIIPKETGTFKGVLKNSYIDTLGYIRTVLKIAYRCVGAPEYDRLNEEYEVLRKTKVK